MTDYARAFDFASWSGPSMGGRLEVVVCAQPHRRAGADEAARRAGQRVNAWASRLTRFSETSDLMRLNASGAARAEVRPTLAATLRWAQLALERSEGIVDATLLGARLAAESGSRGGTEIGANSAWNIVDGDRAAIVERHPSVRFDLDGVAKGWIADRAADLLIDWPGAIVDADGDIALHAAPGVEWLIDVADPRADDRPPLVTLRLTGGRGWSQSFGVATSGTSVHRWVHADGRVAHHLIDRRTGLPAETDVVQATVIAASAREAEMIAKSAAILGSEQALPFLQRSAAQTAILLLESGELVATPGVESWLA